MSLSSARVGERSFRKSIGLLHTWVGVVCGVLLFAIFWMGTLSVFDREIDRWMMPATRLPTGEFTADFVDRVAAPRAMTLTPHVSYWQLQFPTARTPYYMLTVRGGSGESVRELLHPVSGIVLDDPGTYGGTEFIYPFHVNLLLEWRDVGHWLVGAAAVAMLMLLVSGVIVHRRIFADFFTFRPHKQTARSTLDLHNLLSVIGLPFHFAITLSGLIILFAVYFPTVIATAFPADRAVFEKETLGDYRRAPSGQPAPAQSLSALVLEAQRRWAEQGTPGVPRAIRVWHPGDANSVVEIRRAYLDRVAMTQQTVYFDAATGELLFQEHARPIRTAQRFISGLHFLQVDHWTLRWLYFLAGLSACAMIATGLLFWVQARRTRHIAQGLQGARIVESLAIGGVAGIVIATLAFFVVNRLLPEHASLGGVPRAVLEVWAFFLAWIGSFAHGLRRSWLEQCWIIAVLAVVAVVLNGITTGDHLPKALAHGDWRVAGMDLMLLAAAVMALVAARRLRVHGAGKRADPKRHDVRSS